MIYLSLGAGVQSSALLVMSALGLKGCPKAEFAVFADTQDEPKWVYEQLSVLETWAAAHGVPVIRVTAGRLANETLAPAGKRRAALPVFTQGKDGREAMLPRQCTEEYKLAPIRRYLRGRLGVKPRARVPKNRTVTALVGISFDERDRIAPARHKWIENRWPLIDAVMRRHDCAELLIAHGLPVPKKSSCIYCPFHDDVYWQQLKDSSPEEFEQACVFDRAIRDSSSRGLRHPVFLHRSLKPLADVTFDVRASFDGFVNECSGHCGV